MLWFHLGKHSIFGRVHTGMKVVKKVGDVQTDQTTDKYVKTHVPCIVFYILLYYYLLYLYT